MSLVIKPRNVTIKDVAQKANVALGTVSRIINGNTTVSPELREHVQAVIQELGYRPNPTAQTLRTQRTHAIGIIVTDLSLVLSRFSSGLFRAMFAMKEIENGTEIHRRVSP